MEPRHFLFAGGSRTGTSEPHTSRTGTHNGANHPPPQMHHIPKALDVVLFQREQLADHVRPLLQHFFDLSRGEGRSRGVHYRGLAFAEPGHFCAGSRTPGTSGSPSKPTLPHVLRCRWWARMGHAVHSQDGTHVRSTINFGVWWRGAGTGCVAQCTGARQGTNRGALCSRTQCTAGVGDWMVEVFKRRLGRVS
jgi:hypothetical protein